MYKTFALALIICSASFGNCSAALVLSGVLDGTLTGGEPKAVEQLATEDIADLSLYALARAGNGSANFESIDTNRILPSISLNAGDYYYAVGNSFGDQTAVFDTVFPGEMRSRNFGVNSNGDDVTGLFFDASGAFAGAESLVDVFGVLGEDGTGTAWEHQDSWAYRNDLTTASPTFNIDDWTIAAPNSLDGLDAAGINAAVPFGTFTAVPEPSSLLLITVMGAGLTSMRRRRS